MTRIDIEYLADMILAAPGWARVGITAPISHIRTDAARELARIIADNLERGPLVHAGDRDQPGLGL